jgi:tRNA(Ile)-lysidine synthase
MPIDDFPQSFRRDFGGLVGHRVLVAYSGGADSTALLHLLASPSLDLGIVAVHVHHGVRGAEADGDADFCATVCRRLGVQLIVHRLAEGDVPAVGSHEAAWRTARYAALDHERQRVDAAAVATGHHRDDLAEGFLMQLIRGSGPRALAGITSGVDTGLIRPLLSFGRTEIRSWLEDRGLQWRQDSSNDDPAHLRNRVRIELLPALEAASPRLREHLIHLATALATDEAYFASELARRALWIDPWHPAGGVSLEQLSELPPALRVRWLHAQVARSGLGKATRRQAELLDNLLDDGQPAAVSVAGRWRLRRAAGQVWLEPPQPPPIVPPRTLTVGHGTGAELPVPGWTIRCRSGIASAPSDLWRRAVRCGGTLDVRPLALVDWRLDSDARHTVRRIVTDALPRHLRRAWPAICEDGRLVWIPGVWQSPVEADPPTLVVEVIRA